MSIWRYIFDSPLIQRADIESLRERQTAKEVGSLRQQRKLELRISQLEEELQEAAVALRALRELMSEKGVLAEGDLEKKMAGLSDEVRAKRQGNTPVLIREKKYRLPTCPQCGRPLQRNRKDCMYCGAENEDLKSE